MFFDVVGLGVFIVIGVNVVMLYYVDVLFLVVLMGVIIGIGGGILCDICV